MRLAAGPIPTITSDWYDQTTETAAFTDLVTTALADLDALEPQMDTLVDPLAALDDAVPDSGELAPLDSYETDVVPQATALEQWDDATIDTAGDAGSTALVAAYNTIPGEAWTPVPPEYVLPDTGGGVPGTGLLTTTISNLTRPGHSDFIDGDSYRLTLSGFVEHGPSGQDIPLQVTLYFQFQGAAAAAKDGGIADAFGGLTYDGAFGPSDVGHWSEQSVAGLSTGDAVNSPSLSWDVAAKGGGGGPTPTQVTVTFTNTSRSGHNTDLIVGDAWLLHITGAPGADVVISGSQNGVALSPVKLGTTDARGDYYLAGVAGTTELGNWVENYSVGGVAWNGSLIFTVS